jgi:hypothetical protein
MRPSAAHSSNKSPAPADVLLRLVLYYEIFRHPLTTAELARLAAGDPEPALAELEGMGRVERRGPWVCAPGRASQIEDRVVRTREAERQWPVARRAARILAAFPWVRGALITGGLSKQSATPGGDVDFLLLVEPGAVWTTKSALQAFRRVLPEPVRAQFCTNYLLATDQLGLDDRNMFTAMELATAVPMHGARRCAEFLAANLWAERYVPGVRWNLERAERAPTLSAGPLAPAIEAAMRPAGGAIERASSRVWDRYWDRKYAWLDAGTRRQRFKRRPEIATNHLHDFQGWVLSEFERRLRAAGAPAP